MNCHKSRTYNTGICDFLVLNVLNPLVAKKGIYYE